MDRHPLDVDIKEKGLYHVKNLVSELNPSDIETILVYVKKTNKIEPIAEMVGGTHETISDLRFYAAMLDDILRLERYDQAAVAGEAPLLEGDDDSDSFN